MRPYIANYNTLKDRFWKYIEDTSFLTDEDCWNWIGHKTNRGHGLFCLRAGRSESAQRFSWLLYRPAIPVGLHVLHKCDNPACVNPSHLWLGTNAENMKDRNLKGRQARGETHASCKITESQAKEIKYNYPNISTTALMSKYKLSRRNINGIRSGEKWKHI